MSDAENENFEENEIELGEEIMSILGETTYNTIQNRQKLDYALQDLTESHFNLGYDLGIVDEHERILKLISGSGLPFATDAAEFLIRNPRKKKG